MALCVDSTFSEPKPAVQFIGDPKSNRVFYMEGIEGYHAGFSEELTEQYGRPHAAYLNRGYFLVKPNFQLLRNPGTGEPIKTGNGLFQGIYELKDIERGEECIMWCYTLPYNLKRWTAIKRELDEVLAKAMLNGIMVDDDGYLPIVFRIGKAPFRNGNGYAVAVGVNAPGLDVPVIDFNTKDTLGSDVKTKKNPKWER